MNTNHIFIVVQRIMRQVLRDKRTLALVFIVPLVVMSLLDVVLTSSNSSYTLALVRPTGQENEALNNQLDTLLRKNDKLTIITVNTNDVDSLLKAGKADAALVFPTDVMQQIRQGKKPAVTVVLEGSDPNVASALKDVSNGIINQLGVSLVAQQATQQAANLQVALPLSILDPVYIYGGSQYGFNDSIAPIFIGVFSFFFIFLLTSVAFLRERSQGTIERIMISPLTKFELVAGYILGFLVFAMIQSLVVLLFVVFVLHIHYIGNLALVFLVSFLLTIGSVNLGIFLSTFARNEFQIIQMIPLVLGIQILLTGAFWPIKQLPAILQPISYILPLTYANDALRDVMLKGYGIGDIRNQLLALFIFALAMIVLSSLTIRRQIA